MDRKRKTVVLPELLIGLLVAAIVVKGLRLYDELPARMASNFNGQGYANASMPKDLFYAFGALVTLFAAGIGLGLRGRGRLVSALAAWFAVGLLAFQLVTSYLVAEANLEQPPRLDNGLFVPALIGFFIFVLGWLAIVLRRRDELRGNSAGS
jgi:hypothetical protein